MASEDKGVIQFTCEHCKVSLTVEGSLAGVTGPCPSCGKSTKAPERSVRVVSREVQREARSRRGTVRVPENPPVARHPGIQSFRPEKASRRVVPEAQREFEEVKVVIRLLLIGLVVLVVILATVYFGFQAFNS